MDDNPYAPPAGPASTQWSGRRSRSDGLPLLLLAAVLLAPACGPLIMIVLLWWRLQGSF